MTEILAFQPVVWALRAFVTVLALVGLSVSAIGLLYSARFFRPRNIHSLLTADLPVFTHVGAEVKILGQELKANAELIAKREEEVTSLAARMSVIEEQVRGLLKVMENASAANPQEMGDGEAERTAR